MSRKKSQGSVIWPLCQNERQVVELRDEKFKSEAIQEKVHKLFRKFSTNIHYLFQQNNKHVLSDTDAVPLVELFSFQRESEKKRIMKIRLFTR